MTHLQGFFYGYKEINCRIEFLEVRNMTVLCKIRVEGKTINYVYTVSSNSYRLLCHWQTMMFLAISMTTLKCYIENIHQSLNLYYRF